MQEMQEMWVWFPGGGVSMEEVMATHASILAWEIPWTEEPSRLQSMGSQRVGHDWAHMHTIWKKNLWPYIWFRKGRETRDQIANISWIIEKAREIQKNTCFCFIDYAKAIDCVDHNKLWKILKKMGLTVHLTCLLRHLYAGQKGAVRTRYGTTDWVQNWERSMTRLYIVTLLV